MLQLRLARAESITSQSLINQISLGWILNKVLRPVCQILLQHLLQQLDDEISIILEINYACAKASSKWEYVKYHQWFIVTVESTTGREVNTQARSLKAHQLNDFLYVCIGKKPPSFFHFNKSCIPQKTHLSSLSCWLLFFIVHLLTYKKLTKDTCLSHLSRAQKNIVQSKK